MEFLAVFNGKTSILFIEPVNVMSCESIATRGCHNLSGNAIFLFTQNFKRGDINPIIYQQNGFVCN